MIQNFDSNIQSKNRCSFQTHYNSEQSSKHALTHTHTVSINIPESKAKVQVLCREFCDLKTPTFALEATPHSS